MFCIPLFDTPDGWASYETRDSYDDLCMEFFNEEGLKTDKHFDSILVVQVTETGEKLVEVLEEDKVRSDAAVVWRELRAEQRARDRLYAGLG